MNSGIISIRYAKALLAYGNETATAGRLYRETGRVALSFAEQPELAGVLANPVLAERRKIELIRAAAGGSAGESFHRFVRLLLRNKRLHLLRWVCLMYGDLYRKEQHILPARLVTAAALPEAVGAALGKRLESLVPGATLEISTQIKPGLIGGYRFYYDTYRLDASVVSRLRTIREKLR